VLSGAVARHLPMSKTHISADRLDLARRLLWLAVLCCLAAPAMMAVDGLFRSGRTTEPLAVWVRPLGGPALALVPSGQPLRRFAGDPAAAPHGFSPWLGGFDPDPARLALCPADRPLDPVKAQNESVTP
jgi:hypothetical protein